MAEKGVAARPKRRAFGKTRNIKELPDASSRPYGPRGGAYKLFYAKNREVLMDGPAGTGKSRALLEKIHAMMIKYPNARGLIIRKTRKSMTESVLVTFEEKVVPPGHPILKGPSRQMRHSYKYPNGSVLVVGGMDAADKIMSTEWDVIGVFESTELAEDDIERLTTRLRNHVIPYQQILMDCNPGAPQHWLNQRCIAKRTRRIKSRHEDNPSVTEEYLDTLRHLTGVRHKRLYLGLWAAQEGLVYELFDEDVHVIKKMPAGWESWRKLRTIDFGFTNPFVCQWWAIDPDGRMYLYREIYRTQKLVEDMARDIVRLSRIGIATRPGSGVGRKGKEKFIGTFADWDAEDRATLLKHGVAATPAIKTISNGIQAVQARLRTAHDGKPRIFFLDGALVEPDPFLMEKKLPYSTIQEFGEYVWPKAKDGKTTLKEVPVDENNHGMDAMRYAVARMDLRRAPQGGWYLGQTYSTI